LPITESLAGAHTYVTTNMKAGTGGGVSGPLVEERSRELLHGQIQQQLGLHWILDSVSLARLVGR
jgi:hypothetical protein